MKIRIEKIVYPGKALGRGEDGIATFTDEGLPHELVDVTFTKRKKSFQEGMVTEIIEVSPERIKARCPHFGICGGCALQHTTYENQLKIKQTYVAELLAQLPDLKLAPIIASPEPWGYRNKMEFSFFEKDGQVYAGLHQKGQFNRYLAIPPCYISDSDFLPILEMVTKFVQKSKLPAYDAKSHIGFYRHVVLRKAKRTNEILLNLVTTHQDDITKDFFKPLIKELKDKITSFYWTENSKISDAVAADALHLLTGKAYIIEEMHIKEKTFSFQISPFSFFQTNSLGAELLYGQVLEYLKPEKKDTVLDLYCGTGTIGLTVAPFVQQVFGVEQIAAAIENAKENKICNKIENITFEVATVEEWIRQKNWPSFNALILDPPRNGLSLHVIEFIERTLPAKLVYVSCNPSTLARDLALLAKTYKAVEGVAVDMFPQTYHVETVVRLQKV